MGIGFYSATDSKLAPAPSLCELGSSAGREARGAVGNDLSAGATAVLSYLARSIVWKTKPRVHVSHRCTR